MDQLAQTGPRYPMVTSCGICEVHMEYHTVDGLCSCCGSGEPRDKAEGEQPCKVCHRWRCEWQAAQQQFIDSISPTDLIGYITGTHEKITQLEARLAALTPYLQHTADCHLTLCEGTHAMPHPLLIAGTTAAHACTCGLAALVAEQPT